MSRNSHDANIARDCFRSGLEYRLVGQAMRSKSMIDRDDVRNLQIDNDALARLDESPQSIAAEMTYCHERASRDLDSEGRRAQAGRLAIQSGLIDKVRQGEGLGQEAAALAISFEDMAVDLSGNGSLSRVSRRLLRVAAKTADRIVLDKRHRSFDGAVSRIATQAGIGFGHAALGLHRTGHIPDDDPRFTIPAAQIKNQSACNMTEFCYLAGNAMTQGIKSLEASGYFSSGRRKISDDLANLKEYRERSRSGDANSWQALLLGEIAVVSERAGMEIHAMKKDPALRDELLSVSVGAVARSNFLKEKIREMDLSKPASSKAREGYELS